MSEAIENVIEFVLNQKTATVTLSQQSFKAQVRRLARQYPDHVKIEHDSDSAGYMLAHIPVSFIKLRGFMKLTDEERERRSQQFSKNKEYYGTDDDENQSDEQE